LAACETPAALRDALAETYRRCGVGELALCRAFRAGRGGKLRPIPDPELPPLDAIVGYGQQKRLLVENTAAFLEGRESNHALLYGDAGTGKSTCVRALLSQFDDSALRLVELQRAQFAGLPGLLSRLRRRGLKFILFLDDLSFEDHETEYKHLKAAIEGGLETMPENVRIYATSNRRHLIRETWSDKRDMEYDEDLHRSDTVAEKLSLAGRFGLNIRFDSPDRRLYYEIIDRLCAERGIEVPADELHRRADAWAIRHGGLSGRTARQFVDDLGAKASEE
ncbi:MAG: ATP-binding protein, partial [Oscillospiraceae bacterium]|nr:ATP-binding protein [Oscillospiraceae bacterium]